MNRPFSEDESGISVNQYLLMMILVLPAFIARYYLFTTHSPLWLDEAMLALNIRARSFFELAQPLAYDQGAPLGYLWLLKALSMFFGDSEFILRAPSIVAGGVSLVLLANLSKKINHLAGRWFAVGAIAISLPAILYSVQVKQYSLDLLISLALFVIAEKYFEPTGQKQSLWSFGLFGALMIWFSHPAVFTLFGIGCVMLLERYTASKRALREVLLMLFGWLASFSILYFWQYKALAENNSLTGFWADYFMPISVHTPQWIFDHFAELIRNPGGISDAVPYWLVVGLFVCGLAILLVRKNRWAAAFGISLLATLAASALGKYPFGGRLALFLIPGIFICIGACFDQFVLLSQRNQALRLGIAGILIVGLLFGSFKSSSENVLHPKNTENMWGALRQLQRGYQNGDVIYLYHFSTPVFAYYASEFNLEDAKVVEGSDAHDDAATYKSDLGSIEPNTRVWFLFSHLVDEQYIKEKELILQAADSRGNKIDEQNFKGTATSISVYQFR